MPIEAEAVNVTPMISVRRSRNRGVGVKGKVFRVVFIEAVFLLMSMEKQAVDMNIRNKSLVTIQVG